MAKVVRGTQTMTSITASVPLSSVPSGCNKLWIQARTADVAYKLNGHNAVAADDQVLIAGHPPTEWNQETDGFKFTDVRVIQAAASATLHIVYFGEDA